MDDRQKALAKKALVTACKLRTRHTLFTEPKTRIAGHNFAIRLLQTLEAQMEKLRESFQETGDAKHHYGLQKAEFTEVVLQHVKECNQQEGSWLSDMGPEVLATKVGEVFEGADATGKGRVTFEELTAYVIDCSLQGRIGRVEEDPCHRHETAL